jgi:hypothetical protein
MIQQSQEKQKLERIKKKDKIIKMDISKLDMISTTYFANKKLEIIQKRCFNF